MSPPTTSVQPRLIGAQVLVPFNEKDKSAHATLRKYYCRCPSECPLLAKRQCIHAAFFRRCLYGSMDETRSHTPRSRAYRRELTEFRAQVKTMPPAPDSPTDESVNLIGDFYHLPYQFMCLCKDVAFHTHSGLISLGVPFVPKDSFGPAQVVTLAKFRPQDTWCREVLEYQQQELPRFLFHLKHKFPDMYAAAVELDPTIEGKTLKTDVVENLKCTLDQVPFGTVQGYTVTMPKGQAEPVAHEPGRLVVKGKYDEMLYSFSRSNATADSVATIEFVPDPRHVSVTITDPSLIRRIVLADPSLVQRKR